MIDAGSGENCLMCQSKISYRHSPQWRFVECEGHNQFMLIKLLNGPSYSVDGSKLVHQRGMFAHSIVALNRFAVVLPCKVLGLIEPDHAI